MLPELPEPVLYLMLAAGAILATWVLIRASNDLCRSAKRDYHNPNGGGDAPEDRHP